MDAAGGVFLAVLLREHDDTERCAVAAITGPRPPQRLRIPAVFAEAMVYDLFDLVDPAGWPARAAYRYVSTIPCTTTDLISRG